MKKTALLIALCSTTCLLQGKNGPKVTSTPTAVSQNIPLPKAYTAPAAFNYTRSYVPITPRTIPDFNTNILYSLTTTYTNGLDQPLQTSIRLSKDLVSVYDNRVLQDKPAYLPYVAPSGNAGFRINGFSEQKNWYAGAYNEEGDNAYNRIRSELTPGNKKMVSYSAGANFTGLGRGTATSTEINAGGEVYRFGTEPFWTDPYPKKTGTFNAGDLLVKKTEGPHGALSYEYYNRNNQIVCKKVIAGTVDVPQTLSTYYVYDALGRIIWVITPKAIETLENTGWPSVATAHATYDGLCYQYFYNKYGQVTDKRIPDRGMESVVYDRYHRAVLSRTSLLESKGKWAFQIYDKQGRPRFSGLVASIKITAQWQSLIDAAGTTAGSIEDYLVNGYTTGTYPGSLAGCEINAYNYYDDYNFDARLPMSGRTFYTGHSASYGVSLQDVRPEPYGLVKGLLTATYSRVMGSTSGLVNNWVASVYFYDSKGRAIQTQTRHPWSSDWDITTSQYTFTGKASRVIMDHHAPAGSSKPATRMLLSNFYENGLQNRLQYTNVGYDGVISKNIVAYEYDELGRIKLKNIGNGLEKQALTYNIRGQVNGINSDYLYNNRYPNATFGCRINYDNGFQEPRYNGAISGITWRGAGTNSPIHAYGYEYDNAGQMTSADFNEWDPTSTFAEWTKNRVDYSVSDITYDVNGNIGAMKQQGIVNNTGTFHKEEIDDLTYFYKPNSNRLDRVEDSHPDFGGNDFVNRNAGSTDYTYDADGNLQSDANKQINNITYNEQDLPVSITSATGTVQNIYDAAGVLQQKTITNTASGSVEVYRYIGPFVYKDNQLQYALHSEGRARWDKATSTFIYDYFIKDHLGNVRSVISDETVPVKDYRATHELASAGVENSLFEIPNRSPKPAGTPGDMTAVELNGADPSKRIGTSILLKVMAGDQFKAQVSAYYDGGSFNPQGEQVSNSTMVSALLGTLTGGITNLGSESGGTELIHKMFSGDAFNVYDAVKMEMTDPSQPRAYLNYVLLDEQMQLSAEQSGVLQTGAASRDNWADLEMPNDITVLNNGYLLVYLSDESHTSVYLDDLRITYSRGKLLEEQHYYPHGLVVQNGKNDPIPNRYLYQGKELQDEGSMQLYDFHARQYDPQIGRFWGVDPMDQFPSGYTGMGNDPGNMIDPNGMLTRYTENGGGGNNIGIANSRITHHYSDNIFDDAFNEIYNSVGVGGGSGGGEVTTTQGEAPAESNPDTDVYTTKGEYAGRVKDNLPNQIHFADASLDQLKAVVAILNGLSDEDRSKVVAGLRAMSVAFMGEGAAKQLEKMALYAASKDQYGTEIPFYSEPGKSRELNFTFFSENRSNTQNLTNLGDAVKQFTKAGGNIENTFGTGHPHVENWFNGYLYAPGRNVLSKEENMAYYNKPTPATKNPYTNQMELYDYNNVYQRQVPLFIISPVGLTLYNTNRSLKQVNYYYNWFKK